jgi:hypothetical protein
MAQHLPSPEALLLMIVIPKENVVATAVGWYQVRECTEKTTAFARGLGKTRTRDRNPRTLANSIAFPQGSVGFDLGHTVVYNPVDTQVGAHADENARTMRSRPAVGRP